MTARESYKIIGGYWPWSRIKKTFLRDIWRFKDTRTYLLVDNVMYPLCMIIGHKPKEHIDDGDSSRTYCACERCDRYLPHPMRYYKLKQL